MKKIIATFLVMVAAMSIYTYDASAKSTQTFSDVPISHWAYSYIEQAVEKGYIDGISAGRYDPEGTVSNAQFVTMLVRAFMHNEMLQNSSKQSEWTQWWGPYVQTALDTGLLNGMALGKAFFKDGSKALITMVERPISRFDMAEAILSMIGHLHIEEPSSAAITRARASIADYGSMPTTHRVAVDFAYASGCLTGVDSKGTFAGDSGMTRAQAAVVLIRLDELNTTGRVSGTVDMSMVPQNGNDITQGYWLLYAPNPDQMEIYRFYSDGTFEYRNPHMSLNSGHYELNNETLSMHYSPTDREYTYDATEQCWTRSTTRFGNVEWPEVLTNCSTCNDFFMAPEWIQQSAIRDKQEYENIPRTAPYKSVVDYLGLTVNDVANLWGTDFQYSDYWLWGTAKPIYYIDFPVMLYFLDSNQTGKASGEEKIIIVECYPLLQGNGMDAIEEIAPNIPLRVNSSQLAKLGYKISDASDLSEHEFGGATALSLEYDSQITIFFFWDNSVDASTTPANKVLIWDKSI